MFMLLLIKKVVKNFFLNLKWKNKCSIAWDADVSLSSTFEGMNKIHPKVSFHGKLGYGSYLGWNVNISAFIGRFSSIAPNVSTNCGKHPFKYPFATTNPCFYSLNLNKMQNGSTFAKEQLYDEFEYYDKISRVAVKIGSDCWVGEGAFIVGGVQIADGAVVLAHAVVTKDVPAYAIVGGVPAKILGFRYDDETISFLKKIQWWNNTNEWFNEHWKLLSNLDELRMYYEKKLASEKN